MGILFLIVLYLHSSRGQAPGDAQKWTYKIGYGPLQANWDAGDDGGIYGTVRYFSFQERLWDLKDLVSRIVSGESHPCYADTGCETDGGLGYRIKYKYAIKVF